MNALSLLAYKKLNKIESGEVKSEYILELPNGVKNIFNRDGMVEKVAALTITRESVERIVSIDNQVYALVRLKNGRLAETGRINDWIYIKDRKQVTYYTRIGEIGSYYCYTPNDTEQFSANLYFIFPENTSLDQAREDLEGTVIYYELAEYKETKMEWSGNTELLLQVKDTMEKGKNDGINLYNPDYMNRPLVLTTFPSGKFADSINGRGISFSVPVVAGEIYSLSRLSKGSNRFGYAFSAEEPADGVEYWGARVSNTSLKIENIVIPENANYLCVYLDNGAGEGKVDDVKLEKGSISTIWTPFGEDVFYKMIKEKDLPKTLYGDFSSVYSSKQYNGTLELGSTTSDDVYQMYDNLLEGRKHSKNLLGYADVEEQFPIYEYVIYPPTGNSLNDPPVILISSGVHGDEKVAVYGLIHFLNDMLQGTPEVTCIKNNVVLKIVPLVNPRGYDADTRNNPNNVNLNRNFLYNWNVNTESDKGSAAYSERETQIVRDWIHANQDAYALVDFHNMASTFVQGNHDIPVAISYLDTPSHYIKSVYSSLIRELSALWVTRYPDFVGDYQDEVFGYVIDKRYPCLANEGVFIAGIKHSAMLEAGWSEVGYNRNITAGTIERAADIIGNYLKAMLKNYPC